MARKKHEEEHENHERWLVSYADFITLLFAFFVVLYSVSRVDNKRLSQAANSIRWALHYDGTGGVGQMPVFDGPAAAGGNVLESSGAGPAPTPAAVLESVRRRVETKLRPFLLQRPTQAAVTVDVRGSEVSVRLAATDFFDPGQAVLRPDVLPILDAIAEEVAQLARPVRVEGHTDATPVASGPYHDNWALSAARAATVVSYLERAHHLRPGLLAAAGYGASRPIASGDSAPSRDLNRRIEVVVELGVIATAPDQRELPRYDPMHR